MAFTLGPARLGSDRTIGSSTIEIRVTETACIDNFIVRLRRYIEERSESPKFLLTVRGVGYRFQPPAE